MKDSNNNINRRQFMKTTATLTAAAALSGANKLFAAGSDSLKLGLIGCGGRGSHSAIECLKSSEGVDLVAIGELFEDRLKWGIRRMISRTRQLEFRVDSARLKYTDDTCYVGFDAYKKVIDASDVVILTTSPHFRPEHLRAAVEAGKHVFMEKPVAVDAWGVRSIIESSAMAQEKKLAIVAGTQRRHQEHYLEIMKRIHRGDIGDILAAECYWIGPEVAQWGFLHERQPDWSDMENQIRNWYYYVWGSGDHICEQHVHNIDVVNWALEALPVTALGVGGRQARTGPEFGNIWDHFAVEFEYAGGVRVFSMCRQTSECTDRVSELIIGTKGRAYLDESTGYIEGDKPYKYDGRSPNPYIQEHADLIKSIRDGKPLNEGKRVAESTMCAILGRTSAYTGMQLKWEWMMQRSQQKLGPEKYEWTDLEVEPAAVPGVTPLV